MNCKSPYYLSPYTGDKCIILYIDIYAGNCLGVTTAIIGYYHIVPVTRRQMQSYKRILGILIAEIFTITQPNYASPYCLSPYYGDNCMYAPLNFLHPYSRNIHHHLTVICLSPSHGDKCRVLEYTPIAGITLE